MDRSEDVRGDFGPAGPRSGSPGGKKRVAIVESLPLVREFLVGRINQEPGWEASVEPELDVAGAAPPDLLVIGHLQDFSPWQFLSKVKAAHPHQRILLFCDLDAALCAGRVAEAGACGVVPRDEPVSELIAAIRQALNGAEFRSDRVQRRLREGWQKRGPVTDLIQTLSRRESEILSAIGRGKPREEIALDLAISIRTVETHRTHLRKKLQLRSVSELARTAHSLAALPGSKTSGMTGFTASTDSNFALRPSALAPLPGH